MAGQVCEIHETCMNHSADVDRSHMNCGVDHHHSANRHCCDSRHTEVAAGGNLLQRVSTVEARGNCIRCAAVERTEAAGLADTRAEGNCFFHRHLLEESIRHFAAHYSVHHPLGGNRRNRPYPLGLDLCNHRLLSLYDSHRDREPGSHGLLDFREHHSQSAEDMQAGRKKDSLAM